MKVNLLQLKEGCIVLEDIYSASPNPIMLKKTVLNSDLIEVLRAFLVKEVEISDVLNNGQRFSPVKAEQETQDKDPQKTIINISNTPYEDAVNRFKEQFSRWQSGASINSFSLQGILLTLLNYYLSKPYELFRLHEKTTEEDYIFHHSVSVGLMSAYLAQKMKYPKTVYQEVGLAGMLIDCGMAKIPPHYLFKTKELDQTTAELLSKHPVFGYQMLKKVSSLTDGVMLAVLQHHEREDGSGYPLGVIAAQLHPYSKILMVIDAYHAMVSNRHYRKPISPFKALEVLNKDISKFDPRALLVLTQEIPQLFVGNQITLSNGQTGEIIFIPSDNPTRPMVRLNDGQAIALSQNPSLLVDKIN